LTPEPGFDILVSLTGKNTTKEKTLMAKTIHLNMNGFPYCGTKGNNPEITGDIETGYIPDEVTCKRCKKKAEKNGLKPSVPFWTEHFEKNDREKTEKNKQGFDILDMSEFDNDPNWTSIKDEIPPLSVDMINTVDCLYKSEDESLSVVANHRIRDDINLLRFSRITHWKFRDK
jgi:hypothetical protein